MAKSRKNLRFFLTLIFAVALVFLAYQAGRSVQISPAATGPSVSSEPSLKIIESASPTPSTEASLTSRQLVALTESQGNHQIVAIDPVTKVKKVLFTDRDEVQKIKQVSNLSADGTELLVLLGDPQAEFEGTLATIATDGSGTKTALIEDFASPWPPAFSPDGKKIAYVSFSNAEKDAGFSLVVANRDGTNKREIVRETKPITQPVFAPSGTEIAYIREVAPAGASIMSVPVSGGKATELVAYQERVPYDLTWARANVMAFVDGTGDQAEMYVLEPNQPEPTKLILPSGRENRPVFSADTRLIGFTTTSGKTTTLAVYTRNNQTTETYGTVTTVIGWLER